MRPLFTAANRLSSENPGFTATDFRRMMPEFSEEVVPDEVIARYVKMAHAVVKKARWHELWEEGMRLYVAHFLMLFLEGSADESAGVLGILNAGMARGAVASKSVGAVSVSYDAKAGTDGLSGWGGFQLTNHGVAFATLARMHGKAGIFVR